MATADFLVIGGGIVGVTVAMEAARRYPGRRVVLLEKEDDVARHASGRNSGVLHAGLYYPAGSLKARFAREGNRRMTEYCGERGLPINRCGKLVVARSDAEQAGLDELLRRGRGNGVELEEVDEAQARELDPAARVRDRALFSPNTASVDPGAVVRALADDARALGVEVRRGEPVVDGNAGRGGAAGGETHRGADSGVVVRTERETWSAGYVVNAAGAYADRVAGWFGFGAGYRILPFKGRYLRAESPVQIRRHIYPVPDLRYPFLGVHFTVAVNGDVWIGPTATPVLGKEQYDFRHLPPGEAVQNARRLGFLLLSRHNSGLRRLAVKEIRRHSRRALVAEAGTLARGLPPARRWAPLRPGIRAQLVDTRTWSLVDDFVYQADDRSLHVLNAVSPGFTCAFPLAEHLLDIIDRKRDT